MRQRIIAVICSLHLDESEPYRMIIGAYAYKGFTIHKTLRTGKTPGGSWTLSHPSGMAIEYAPTRRQCAAYADTYLTEVPELPTLSPAELNTNPPLAKRLSAIRQTIRRRSQ